MSSPVPESLALVRAIDGVDCLIVSADGRIDRSEGFGRHETSSARSERRLAAVQEQAKPEKPAAEAGSWDADYELVIRFELNNPTASRGFRRPYVAIWAEDKDGFPVRTLTLWGRGRWVADLKRWHLGEQARKAVDTTDLREAISRPTRPPGKYEVVWDGTDNLGRRVDAGEYTLSIEAVREHGTYQSISKKVNLAGKPFAEEFKGNVEIKSASFEYRRKGQGK